MSELNLKEPTNNDDSVEASNESEKAPVPAPRRKSSKLVQNINESSDNNSSNQSQIQKDNDFKQILSGLIGLNVPSSDAANHKLDNDDAKTNISSNNHHMANNKLDLPSSKNQRRSTINSDEKSIIKLLKQKNFDKNNQNTNSEIVETIKSNQEPASGSLLVPPSSKSSSSLLKSTSKRSKIKAFYKKSSLPGSGRANTDSKDQHQKRDDILSDAKSKFKDIIHIKSKDNNKSQEPISNNNNNNIDQEPTSRQSPILEVGKTAFDELESLVSTDIATKLTSDFTNYFRMNSSERDSLDGVSVESNAELAINNSASSDTSSSSVSPTPHVSQTTTTKANEIDTKKRNKLNEYYNIELKQAKLLKILSLNVLSKLNAENKNQSLFDSDESNKVFYVIVELEKYAVLVHEPVAEQIKKRVDLEWNEKPYFADILTSFYHYYKLYKPILARYPTCQITLSNLLKRKNFATTLKKILDSEAEHLDNVNRIDMLLDRLVDFPRRILQLLEGYVKLLDTNSKEYTDMKKILALFTDIFQASNNDLNKMNNFKLCYELQFMFDPPQMDIADQNRILIKQGPLFKVARRDGDLLLRHLALFSDMLLVSKIVSRIDKKKLQLQYKIPSSELKLIEKSSPNDELIFRIVYLDQNNEFKADKLKDKEEWIKAFKNVKGIEFSDQKDGEKKVLNDDQIGVVPPIWIKDNEQTTCSHCNDAFTAFKRRHHCRTCGKLYCHQCCNSSIPVQFKQFKDKVRVCRICYPKLEKIYQDYLNRNLNQQFVDSQENLSLPQSRNNSLVNGNIQMNIGSNNLDDSFKIGEFNQNIEALRRAFNKIKTDVSSTLTLVSPTPTTQNSHQSDDANIDSDSDSSFDEDFVHDKSSGPGLLESVIQEISIRKNSTFEYTSNKFSDVEHLIKDDKKELPPLPPPKFKKLDLKLSISNDSNNLDKKTEPVNNSIVSNRLNAIKQASKREPLQSEWGYLSKIPTNPIDETEENSDKKSTIKCERTCFVLYSDNTLGICPNNKDLNNPQLVIQLSLFEVKDLDETTFSLIKLKKDEKKLTELSNINDNTSNENDTKSSELIDRKSLGKLKNRVKLFEFNYELKLKNKETKNKWFELISNQKEDK